MEKICEICGGFFKAVKSNQKYCPECGKAPSRAARQMAKAQAVNLRHTGFDARLKKPRTRVCLQCGKTFWVTPHSRSWCSDSCFHEYMCSKARCIHCGKSLKSVGIHAERGYCSEECKQAAAIERAKKADRWFVCRECGEHFVAKSASQKFCSQACRLKQMARQKESRLRAEKIAKENRTKLDTRICSCCGKPFAVTPFTRGRMYCSELCKKAERERRKKENREESAFRKFNKKASAQNLCIFCRTSQKNCERFLSNFQYLPKGAHMELINGKPVVLSCPKFSAPR